MPTADRMLNEEKKNKQNLMQGGNGNYCAFKWKSCDKKVLDRKMGNPFQIRLVYFTHIRCVSQSVSVLFILFLLSDQFLKVNKDIFMVFESSSTLKIRVNRFKLFSG